MYIFFIVIIIIALIGVKAKNPFSSELYTDNFSLKKSNALKGIFVLIILISHATHSDGMYNFDASLFDKLYTVVDKNVIGQSSVVSFFFFSGYGIMYSIEKKGKEYVKSMPTKRCLKLAVHFGLFCAIFLAVCYIISAIKKLRFTDVFDITWFISATWYIFAILVLYLITYFAFKLLSKHTHSVLTVLIVTVAAIVIAYFILYEYWYDTIIIYSLGLLFKLYESRIFSFLQKKNRYIFALCISLVIQASVTFLYYMHFRLFILLEIKHISFLITLLLITYKVTFDNVILQFSGKHLFSIYVLQRIPMLVMDNIGFKQYPYLYVIITVVVTVVLCVLFDYCTGKLDKILFTRDRINKENV